MKRSLALFFLIIFFAACSADRVPDGIIKKEKMISVLTDIHLVDGYASVYYADTMRRKVNVLYKSIYKKYGTDSVQVRKSLEYYTSHPDQLQSMYEKINASLQQFEKEEQEKENVRRKQEEQRIRDSLWLIEERRRDSLNKGFRIDTQQVFPLKKFFLKSAQPKKDTLAVHVAPADSLKTVRRPPLRRSLVPKQSVSQQ